MADERETYKGIRSLKVHLVITADGRTACQTSLMARRLFVTVGRNLKNRQIFISIQSDDIDFDSMNNLLSYIYAGTYNFHYVCQISRPNPPGYPKKGSTRRSMTQI